jgi:hypothetical protein
MTTTCRTRAYSVLPYLLGSPSAHHGWDEHRKSLQDVPYLLQGLGSPTYRIGRAVRLLIGLAEGDANSAPVIRNRVEQGL